MIELEELNVDNWLETMQLSVSEEQKEIFPISNVYWIGINRYEEKTTLYAIKNNYTVSEIHIGHRKTNTAAGKLYESLGFKIFDEDETDYFRKLDLN